MDERNSQLETALQQLHQNMDDDPTSEKPLDALIQVEEALRTMLEVKELSKETKAEIDRVLIGLTGRTISAFLDEIHERTFRVMKSDSVEAKDDIEGYLAKLKIVYRKVEKVILNPDARNGYIIGSDKGIEKKELHANKLQHLLELLRSNEIYTDDICIIIGENKPNMMREGSYLYIEIPKVKRTILLHLGYGEASFVLYDIYDRAKVFDMTKEQIQEKLGAAKVNYAERDLNKWGTEMLKALKLNQALVQPKINMENYDRRLFYIEEIKKLYPTPESFMVLTAKQKQFFNLYGKGLNALNTLITNKRELRPVGSTLDMAIFAESIYGEGHKVIEEALKKRKEKLLIESIAEGLDKEKWKEEIKKLYPTAEEFMALTQEQKDNLKIIGKGLKILATIIIGRTGLKPIQSKRDTAILAQTIYGAGHEVIEKVLKTNETVKWDRERWIAEIKNRYPTVEEFMSLTKRKKIGMKIYNKGLTAVATIILGKSGLDPVLKSQDTAILAKAVYGGPYQIIECEFWDKEKWIAEIKKRFHTPESFMELDPKQRHKTKIINKGLSALATIITGKPGLQPLGNTGDMAILAQTIYGEAHEAILKPLNIGQQKKLKKIETEGWDRDKWIGEIIKQFPAPEDFIALSQKQKLNFHMHGRGLTYLGKLITGIRGIAPVSSTKDMAILAKEIYGAGHEPIEALLNKVRKKTEEKTLKNIETGEWDNEKWIETVKRNFPTLEEFMALTARKKRTLKLHGRGLQYLAAVITGKSGLRPDNSKLDYAILARAIYGDSEKPQEE